MTKEQRAKYVAKKRKTYHDRIKNGLCPRCGGEREDKNYINCRWCRRQASDYEYRRRHPNAKFT